VLCCTEDTAPPVLSGRHPCCCSYSDLGRRPLRLPRSAQHLLHGAPCSSSAHPEPALWHQKTVYIVCEKRQSLKRIGVFCSLRLQPQFIDAGVFCNRFLFSFQPTVCSSYIFKISDRTRMGFSQNTAAGGVDFQFLFRTFSGLLRWLCMPDRLLRDSNVSRCAFPSTSHRSS